MKRLRFARPVVAAALLCAAGPVLADDLHGLDRILCSAVTATVCMVNGECETDLPYNWNIPQFIEIDLVKKVLSTTRASGENRQTPAASLVRQDGWIYLQGVEGGRAFSFVIDETTGFASVAVARQGLTVSVFGACTALPAAR
jgi:hypothetical protein